MPYFDSKRKKRSVVALIVGLGAWMVVLNPGCSGPLKIEPLRQTVRPLVTDSYLSVARKYAPYVYHAVHPTKGRQDIPTRVDFDDDLRGDNNWDNFPSYSLPPTLYYSFLESKSHVFLTYHIFHPRDWSYFRIGLHETHENDGENLQVVIDKATGKVILLFTQAHYYGGIYTNPSSGFGKGTETIRGDLILVNEDGKPDTEGRHAAVFVESYGHGIYGLTDSDVVLSKEGNVTFPCHGLVFRPAQPGEPVAEPELSQAAPVPYQLESITTKLWPGLRDGSLVGEGGLFDGAHPYKDSRVTIGVPGYYEADRFSGPFGPDRGISPFAVDVGWKAGTLGALFFDPASRYLDLFKVPDPWSVDYVNYPFQN